MKLAKLLTFAITLAVVTAVPSFAQQGGRRGPGGPGGFGGGGPLSLVMIPEVQRELKLDEAQIDLLQGLARAEGEQRREEFRGARDLSPEQRRQRFASARQAQEKKIAEILEPSQVNRLRQLMLQREGIRALGRDDVAAALKLTPDQRQKVQAALQAEGEQMRAMFESLRSGGQQGDIRERLAELRPKREALQQGTDAKLAAVLTATQKQQFESLKGAPFTFPERGQRGRDGQRGPRGDRARN